MTGDRIVIEDLKVFGHHGVSAEEQESGQEFIVGVECLFDAGRAGASDNLVDTIDYGWLVETATHVVSQERYKLLEAVAQKVGEAILENPKVDSVIVSIAKAKPPLDASVGSIAVQIERVRG